MRGGGVRGRYLVVRRNDSIVLFNEVLINYGHNKITYVENLRFHGLHLRDL